MPSAKLHKRVSMRCLGKYSPELHFFIDRASQGILKSSHRFLFHDWETLEYLEGKLGIESRNEALLHIILDFEQYQPEKDRIIKFDR